MYVPQVYARKAQMQGLGSVADDLKPLMTPCFIIPHSIGMQKENQGDYQILLNFHDALVDSWDRDSLLWQGNTFYVDFSNVGPHLSFQGKRDVITELFRLLRQNHFSSIPVTTISRNEPFQSSIKHILNGQGQELGLCLRVYAQLFRTKDWDHKLNLVLANLGVKPGNVDLIFDWGYLRSQPDDYIDLLKRAGKFQWRKLIVSMGSFPKTLSNCQNIINELPWIERELFEKAQNASNQIGHKLIYSDYTSRHPFYDPESEFHTPRPNIRHTVGRRIQVYRSTRNQSETRRIQYHKLSKLLVSSKSFKGNNFSAGDRFFAQAATGFNVPADSGPYIKASANHHATVVLREIAG